MSPLLLSTVLLLALPLAADAEPNPAPLPPLELSVVVPAPPEQVWAAFTTTEGVKKWMVSQADLDTRNGGIWKTKYGKEGTLGDEGTIFNEVLAVDPGRMYTLRIQKPPKRFPFMNTYRDMWTVVYFDPAEGGKTRIRLRAHGFKDTEESRKLRAFFEQGNQATLDAAVRYFEKQTSR